MRKVTYYELRMDFRLEFLLVHQQVLLERSFSSMGRRSGDPDHVSDRLDAAYLGSNASGWPKLLRIQKDRKQIIPFELPAQELEYVS